MQKHLTFLAAAAISFGGFALVGCDRSDTNKTASNTGTTETRTTETRTRTETSANGPTTRTTGEKMSDAMKSASDKTKDAVSSAADKTKDTVSSAWDKTKNAVGNTADRTRNSADNAANNASDNANTAAAKSTSVAPDASSIRNVIEKVTQDAVTKNHFDNLVSYLSKADQDRLGKAGNKNYDDLNGRIDQFLKNWKNKYNKDFDIHNENVVFNDQFMTITQGELAGGDMAKANEARTASETQKPENAVDRPGAQGPAEKANSAPGRYMAVANILPSHGAPAVTLNLINEGTITRAWHIDIPDNIDAQKLHDNLLKHLTMMDEQNGSWPADINEAYRMVSHHVLMAITDKEAAMNK